MRGLKNIIAVSFASLALMACNRESKIDMSFSDKYEGKTVELMNFADSTVINSALIKDGKAFFVTSESDSVKFPLFASIVIDGRVRAYYIVEPGQAQLSDSISVPTGTPSNDKFATLLAQLDSVESLDDMAKYVDFAENKYNENKDNVFGPYFGVEWLKYAEPAKVDSFMNKAPEAFRNARRVKHYEGFARLRGLTSPGKPYVDFAGENVRGGKVMLSQLVPKGKYTLVDFWASWCPYCIKELPEMKALYTDYKDKGFDIVGVAVRDKSEDTQAMAEKKEIPWKILFNTQKVPYDIYGFSGIPHHMLIGPDGTIISRGESVEQIRIRLASLIPTETKQ